VQTSGHGLEGASSPLRPDGRPLLLERETWPATLLIELAAFAGPSLAESLAARYGPLPSPEALALFDALGIPRDALRSDCFYAQAAAWLFDREAPDLAMLYLPGPDVIRRVLAKSPRPAAEREAARQRALAAYWEALEGPLAAIVARADSAASLQAPVRLFLTQPGLPWEEGPARGNGIFSLSGPGTMATEAPETLPLADVAPTVLWMLGLPVARDMSGGPHLLLAPEEAARLSPVRFIPTYGRQQTEGLEQAASSLDQEMLERFRSLGYIQ